MAHQNPNHLVAALFTELTDRKDRAQQELDRDWTCSRAERLIAAYEHALAALEDVDAALKKIEGQDHD